MARSELTPQWTIPPARATGRDHLGMQAPSIALYSSLVPSLTNITLRARYYAFYPWWFEQYARRRGQTSRKAWQGWVRAGEALLALASSAATPEGWCQGAAGVIWASRCLTQANGSTIDFASASKPGSSRGYLNAPDGGFGRAYVAPLLALRVIDMGEKHGLPVPGRSGKDLATAFGESIGDTGERFTALIERGSASPTELAELGSVIGLNALEEDSRERELLEALLLNPRDDLADAAAQRETFALCLTIAARLGRTPTVEELRWILYSGRNEDGEDLQLSPVLSQRAHQWQAYQANELTHVALEAILRLVTELLPSGVAAVPLQEFVARVVRSALEHLPSYSNWAEFRNAMPLAGCAMDKDAETSEYTLHIDAYSEDPSVAAAAALKLLAILDKRWNGTEHAVAATFGIGTPLRERFPCSVMGILEVVRGLEAQPLERLLALLIKRHVLEQHLRVALRKLRQQTQRTFLFELQDGRLVGRATTGPVFTNPRLRTSLTFLRDLYLLDDQGPTPRGRNFLRVQ